MRHTPEHARSRALIRALRIARRLSGQSFTPTHNTLARDYSVCRRTILRDLAALQAAGWPIPPTAEAGRMSKFPNASEYLGSITICQHCKGVDIKITDAPLDFHKNFIRTFWCRTCWHESPITLHEDRPERLKAAS